jgi:glutaredoxin
MKKVKAKTSSKKSSKKNFYITLGIVVLVLILAVAIIFYPKDKDSTAELAKCIGEKATLYVQYGCPHCRTQEELFGENIKYINSIDCYQEENREKCKMIQATPTWIINGEQYLGVQSLAKLKELTNC